jgi:splicing factor 1
MKAHLAGIASKFGVRSGPVNGPFHGFTQGIGAADGGPTPADSDDPEVVARYLRFVEASRKLDERDFTDNRHTRERSPSPPPKYDNRGARVNTREWRMEQKLKGKCLGLPKSCLPVCPYKTDTFLLQKKKRGTTWRGGSSRGVRTCSGRRRTGT